MLKTFDEKTVAALRAMQLEVASAKLRFEGAQSMACRLIGVETGVVLKDMSGVEVPESPKEPPDGTE